MKNKVSNHQRFIGIGTLVCLSIGLLTGCGSTASSSNLISQSQPSATNGAASSNNPASAGQAAGGKGQQMRNPAYLEDQLKKAGVSDSDAKALAQLVKQYHVKPNWISSQLKNGRSVSDIENDIKSGKAPIMTPRNGQKSGNSTQNDSNAPNQSDSNSANQTQSSNQL